MPGNQDSIRRTGEFGTDSNEPNSNRDVNVIMARDVEPLKSCKMNQAQPSRSNIRSQYQVCGSMRVRMESSQLFKLAFFGFAILIGLGFLVCLRLNTLENQIVKLKLELQAVKEFNQLSADQAVFMQDDSSDSGEAVTPLVSSTSEEKSDELLPKMNNDLGLVRRSRRSVNSIPSQVVPSNASSLLIDTSLEFESVEISNATTMSSTSRISRHLKLGAGAGRRRADRERDVRASYLIPTGAHVNIDRAEQYIGPWHLAYDTKDIGFNDMWYDGVSLDENGTSIVFNESGLYSISSQVYYHSTVQRGRTMPMGYKIFVKKAAPTKFQRPFEVAQCVTAYPSTYFQTCYTAVTWYLEKRDEIFLKHFKNSFPIIEADEQGKTFLQIVKLG